MATVRRPTMIRIAAVSALALGLGVPAGMALGIYASNAIQPLPPAATTDETDSVESLADAAVEQQIGAVNSLVSPSCIGCGPGPDDRRFQAEQGDDALYADRVAQSDERIERYGDGLVDGYSVDQPPSADTTETSENP